MINGGKTGALTQKLYDTIVGDPVRHRSQTRMAGRGCWTKRTGRMMM